MNGKNVQSAAKRRTNKPKKFSAPVLRESNLLKVTRIPQPLAYDVTTSGSRMSKMRIEKGTEYIGLMVTYNNVTDYNAPNCFPISPTYWQNTRIAVLASLYERYVIVKMKFRYVPSVASTATGAISMWIDKDIDDPNTFTSEAELDRVCLAHQGSVGPVRAPLEVSYLTDGKSRYTGNRGVESRKIIAGNLVTAASGHGSAGWTGKIYVDYTIALIDPTLGYTSGYVAITPQSASVSSPANNTPSNTVYEAPISLISLGDLGLTGDIAKSTPLTGIVATVGADLAAENLGLNDRIYLAPKRYDSSYIYYHVFRNLSNMFAGVGNVANDTGSAWSTDQFGAMLKVIPRFLLTSGGF